MVTMYDVHEVFYLIDEIYDPRTVALGWGQNSYIVKMY